MVLLMLLNFLTLYDMHELMYPAISTFIDVGVAMVIGLKVSIINIVILIFDH